MDSLDQYRDKISWRDEGKLAGKVTYPGIALANRSATAAELPSPSRPIASTSSLTSPVLGLGVSKAAPEIRAGKPKGARTHSLADRLRKKPRKGVPAVEEPALLDEGELRRLAELERRIKLGPAASSSRRSALSASDGNVKRPPSLKIDPPPQAIEAVVAIERESPPSPSPQPRSQRGPVAESVETEPTVTEDAEDPDSLLDDSLDIALSQLPVDSADQTADEMPSLAYSSSSHDTTADTSILSIDNDLRRIVHQDRRSALLKTATQRAQTMPLPEPPAKVEESISISEAAIDLPGPTQSQRMLGTSRRRGDASQEEQKLRKRFVPMVPNPGNARKPSLAPLHPDLAGLDVAALFEDDADF